MFLNYFLIFFFFKILICSEKESSIEAFKKLFQKAKHEEGINKFFKKNIFSKEINFLDLNFKEEDVNKFFSNFSVTFPREIFEKIKNNKILQNHLNIRNDSVDSGHQKEVFIEKLLFGRLSYFDNFGPYYFFDKDRREKEKKKDFFENEKLFATYLSITKKVDFLNNGEINKYGAEDTSENYFKSGYIITVNATIFDVLHEEKNPKIGYTDYASTIITRTQNIIKKIKNDENEKEYESGYGKGIEDKNMEGALLIQKIILGGENNFPTFQEAENLYETSNENNEIKNGFFKTIDGYFNAKAYEERIKISINSFLKKADILKDPKADGVTLSVLGIGLGIWEKKGLEEIQEKLMLKVYAEILKKEDLKNIKNIRFLYFKEDDSYEKEVLMNVLIDKEINFEFVEYNNEIEDGHPAPYEKTEYLKNENLTLVSMFPCNAYSYIGGDEVSNNFFWNLSSIDRAVINLSLLQSGLLEKALI